MTKKNKRDYIAEGQRSYQQWRDKLLSDPENRRIYEEESAKLRRYVQALGKDFSLQVTIHQSSDYHIPTTA